MSQVDRLTTLIDRFNLRVTAAPLAEATLAVTAASDGTPCKVYFSAEAPVLSMVPQNLLFAARVDWGGVSNPLIAALPPSVEFSLSDDLDGSAIVSLMQSELAGRRCAAGSVVNRLCEVLIVRMLRAQIQAGATNSGILAGLSDPRLSRAITAMHDHPGRNWRNEDFAREAGLSLSRFAETFLATVGETPAAYLRRWRLVLARQDVEKGDRVDTVSRRYGYASPEGFARAFRKHFGHNPVTLRTKAAA